MLPFEIEKRMDEFRLEIGKLGAELIDIHVRRGGSRSTLVITADKAGGITMDDCAKINSHLGHYLDEFPGEGGFFASAYYLEVNSPGLDRPLRSEIDFLRVKGREVRIAYKADNGAGLVKIGEVIEVQNGILKLKLPNEEQLFTVSLQAITKANMNIRIGK
jgi:ribosome maturation factor RimP